MTLSRATASSRAVALELALLDLARQEVLDPPARRARRARRSPRGPTTSKPASMRDLRDSGAHGAQTDDADRANLHDLILP